MRGTALRRGGVLAVALALAACGLGSSSDGRPGDTKTVSSQAGAATTSAVTLPVPQGVTLGTAVDADMGWGVRTIATADEFVEFSVVGGEVAISLSSDGGRSWEPVAADLEIDGVALAATNGREVFVSSGYGSLDSPPVVSVSADGGSTWTTSALAVPAVSDSPYMIEDTTVSALAVTDTAALAVGAVLPRVDWQRYSIDVLGVDHGHVTGEGGGAGQWEVTFEDGYTVSVDLTAIGLSESVISALVPVGWALADSGWEIIDLPFMNPSGQDTQLVVGPAGFLMLPQPAQPVVGVGLDAGSSTSQPATTQPAGLVPPSTLLYHSTDGRSWYASSPPEGLQDWEGFLVGGPLGYVIVGETTMWFSADGVEWSVVTEYEDAAPDTSGYLSAFRPAGGSAGFAVAFGDVNRGATGGTARVLVSRDGRSWEAVPLPDGTIDAIVAVGSDSMLVRPVVTTTTGTAATVDTSPIPEGAGGAGGPRPAAMCDPPESVMIVAYDLDTGAYRWHRCGPGTFYVLEAATPSAVYVRDVSQPASDVLAFDAATGDELDSSPADQLDQVLPDDAARPTTKPPETPGLTVTGGQDDRLIVSNSTTGDEIWSTLDFLAYDDVWAVGDGAVFMAHREATPDTTPIGSLRAYELETGEIRWETETHVESYPWWVADGRVFSIWTDLTVLTTTAGDVLWTTDYGTQDFPGMRGVLANDDTVFVSFANGWGGGD